MKDARNARPIGRILRLLMGVALSLEGGRHVISASGALNLKVLGVIVGLFMFYAVVHFAIGKFVSAINAWLGAALAVIPVALVFLLGGPPGQLASLLFIGVSLVLTAIRSDGGCEVMVLPGMLLGKKTHLVCVVFSPLDWIEDKIANRIAKNHSANTP